MRCLMGEARGQMYELSDQEMPGTRLLHLSKKYSGQGPAEAVQGRVRFDEVDGAAWHAVSEATGIL